MSNKSGASRRSQIAAYRTPNWVCSANERATQVGRARYNASKVVSRMPLPIDLLVDDLTLKRAMLSASHFAGPSRKILCVD